MVTLNQLAYDLLELVRPNIADDEAIDLRQVKFWIHNQRALWLRNELNRFRTIDDNIIQDLGCVELEVADRSTCADLPIDCDILRTKKEIPNTIELHNKTALTRIGPLDKTMAPYSIVEYNRAIFSGNGRFNRQQIFAFLLNNRVYLKISPLNKDGKYLEYLNIRGVFETPTDVAGFNDPEGVPCYTDNTKYPVNRWMIDYMKDAIVKSNLILEQQAIGDTVNDSQTLIPRPQPVKQ